MDRARARVHCLCEASVHTHTADRACRNSTATRDLCHPLACTRPSMSSHAPLSGGGDPTPDRRVWPVCARGGEACGTRPERRVLRTVPTPLDRLCAAPEVQEVRDRLSTRTEAVPAHTVWLPTRAADISFELISPGDRPRQALSCAHSSFFIVAISCSYALTRLAPCRHHESAKASVHSSAAPHRAGAPPRSACRRRHRLHCA